MAATAIAIPAATPPKAFATVPRLFARLPAALLKVLNPPVVVFIEEPAGTFAETLPTGAFVPNLLGDFVA
jgi:hypothetical protein